MADAADSKAESAVLGGIGESPSAEFPGPARSTPEHAGQAAATSLPDDLEVERALVRAIEAAVTAGQWAIVGQLGKELEARRLARSSPNVVKLSDRKRRS
jgi:hypothetical protein